MDLFINTEDCCGCTACESICPKNAITMKADKEGFLYPKINKASCVQCGLCKNTCGFNSLYYKDELFNEPLVFAAKHKDNNERMTSRSGGVFIALSDFILDKNGVVYGAGYDEKLNVCHKRATTKEQRDEFKGSKYVQSRLNNTFKLVKSDLENDKYVLFSGTPCQVAGLKKYIGKSELALKLYTCDIVCHGVPSPLIWRKYMDFISDKYKIRINKADFRDKSFGWGGQIESFYYKDKDGVDGKKSFNYYANLFHSSVIVRPSCFKCKFTNLQRPSDITLGDFWGIDEAVPRFNDNKGVSLVLVNTQKGNKIFSGISKELIVKQSNINNCMQPNMKEPTKKPKNREKFWEDYNQNGFKYIVKKYTEYGFRVKVNKRIKHYYQAIAKKVSLII